MKIQTQKPFSSYHGYIVTNPENRKNVCLVHKNTKRKTTVSYARYLMSVHKRRKLKNSEQVDHINGDKTDDRIENLQILTVLQNNIKSVIERGITRKIVKIKCPSCKEVFIREERNTHIGKKGKYTCCSKRCSNAILRLKLSIEKMIEIGNSQVIEKSRK